MSILKLNIEQQWASLEIRTTPAQMHITMPRPRMKIVQEQPEMEIEREGPTFRLNRKKVMEESGLKQPMALTKAFRDLSRGRVVDFILDSAREGEYLGKVEQGGNRVARLAREKSLKSTMKEINLGAMPQSKPEIQWDPGSVKVNWSRHRFTIEWEGEFMPEFTVDPKYSIEVYLREKPYIRIMVEEDLVPYEIGLNVDEKR